MKKRSELPYHFESFQAMVSTQSGENIQQLRSDGAYEYTTSLQFQKIVNRLGITHQVTMPYSPQQNGIAERTNRTLMNMTRCMLEDSILPRDFWEDAIAMSTFVLNRTPSRTLSWFCPFHYWFDSKPDLSSLRKFGSLCMVKIPD